MSEQDNPKSYMQQLDEWIEGAVISPLIEPLELNPNEDFEQTIWEVKKAIREKVLESYHNGKAAKAPGLHNRTSYAKR
jgi:hypothetical protein